MNLLQNFELVPFDELKYLADKNTTLTGNFNYTFILTIQLYTIIFITHDFLLSTLSFEDVIGEIVGLHGNDRGAWEKIEQKANQTSR